MPWSLFQADRGIGEEGQGGGAALESSRANQGFSESRRSEPYHSVLYGEEGCDREPAF